MGRLGMPVSDDTLLRCLKRAAVSTGEPLRMVGVDDWAWKRGHHYGTILVDFEGGQTVDLLLGRSADE